MTNAMLRGKPDAGNPHARFDEGEVASTKPRRGFLPYTMKTAVVSFGALPLLALGVSAATIDAVTLDGEPYVCPSEDTTVSNLTVTTGSVGNTVTVPAGVTMTVHGYRGGGALEKLGRGKLVVCDVDPAARIVASEGDLLFDRSQGVASLASAAGLHLDASKADSFAFVNDDGINISNWYDVRDAKDAPLYPHAYFSWGARPCRYADQQNGCGIVDFFTTTDGWTPCMLLMSSDHAAEDFAYGKGPGVTGVRELFMVVRDRPNTNLTGRKYQSFLCDYDAPSNYNYWFCRGDSGEIWSSAYNETAGLRGGSTWVDGAAVSGTSVFPSGGFHLLRARRSNSGRFSALCYDHQGASAGLGGGLAIGELIVFRVDGQPSDETAAAITARLTHKWFGKQTLASLRVSANANVTAASGESVSFGNGLSVTSSGVRCVIDADKTCVISDNTYLPFVEVTGDNATLTVADGVTVEVSLLTGTGTLVKKGEGTVVVRDVDANVRIVADSGLVRFAMSEGVSSLAKSAGLHLDASLGNSIETVNGDGVNVTVWRDVRDVGGTTDYPRASYSWGAYPTVKPNGQNGLTTVEFYNATDGWKPCMLLMSSDHAAEDFAYGKGPGVTGVRELFMVVRDRPNTNLTGRKYQSFLCDYDAPSNYNYWFCRGDSGEIWSSAYNETAGLRGGSTWVDGAAVSGTSVFPSDGFHLLRARRSNSGRFSALCYDHQNGSSAGLGGGLEIGELVVFRADGQPSDETGAAISRKLMHKWTGRQPMSGLSVGANGKVEVASGESLQPTALTLARLDAVAGETPLQPTDLTVAESGTVVLTIPAGYKAKGGRAIPLVTASGTLTGAEHLDKWSVVCDWKYGAKLTVVDKTLCAVPNPSGLLILIR